MPNAVVKSALESALIAIIVSGACLYFLISATQAGEPSPAMTTLWALGLIGGTFAHWSFMAIALKRAGRSRWLWMPLLVLLFPVASVVLGIVMMNQDEEAPVVADNKVA